ncbi:RNA polymerase sigma factor [Filimonas effusa]|uniref:RNA polymerase sigma-70 factor n=1 Tax=Filimonas effusa TaxID=2508721 RepID=A0A4Q1D796_9BACT|nr:RNA polymerase sigma-70 factor [Filimonas effusa]RXK83611.1 RNA polymerase sigma-70 factor [Filimonas effusa]
MSSSLSDMELLSRMAEGDANAFQKLFYQHWEKIFSIAVMYTKSEVLAEELVQDIFLKIWLHREKIQDQSNFQGYLFITARNHIYNKLRIKSQETEYRQELHAHFADSRAADDLLILKQSQELIHQAVESLPPQQRKIFILSRYEGLTLEEIGAQMGISPLTARAHMRKALASLRSFLQQHSGDLSLAPVLYILLSK